MTRILLMFKDSNERGQILTQFQCECLLEGIVPLSNQFFSIPRFGQVLFQTSTDVTLQNVDDFIRLINETEITEKPDRIICSTSLAKEIHTLLQQKLSEFILIEPYPPQTSLLQWIRQEPQLTQKSAKELAQNNQSDESKEGVCPPTLGR